MCTICALCGQSAVLTAVRCRAIPGLMQTLPLKKLRNFGGKLGAELEKLGCSTAGQVNWPLQMFACGSVLLVKNGMPHR